MEVEEILTDECLLLLQAFSLKNRWKIISHTLSIQLLPFWLGPDSLPLQVCYRKLRVQGRCSAVPESYGDTTSSVGCYDSSVGCYDSWWHCHSCGHCDCTAGLGETCSHVAALLFTTEAVVRLGYTASASTDELCQRNQSLVSNVSPSTVGSINFYKQEAKAKVVSLGRSEQHLSVMSVA